MKSSYIEETKKFKDLVEKIKSGILVTRSATGELKGRPMATIQVDDDGGLWFFTNEFSEKAKEISFNNEVFLSYSSPSDNDYLVANGIASISNDKEKMKELWTPVLKAWFPDGLEDPKLALLKVEPTEVEYWSGNSNKIVIAFKMLSSIISGETYTDGDHKKIDLK